MGDLISEERMSRFFRREAIDRVPVYSLSTMNAGREKGLSSEEFYFDSAKAFHAQKEIYDEYGYDDTPCLDIPHGEMLDLGGELIFPKEGLVELPRVRRFMIQSLEDAEKYELPSMEKRKFTQQRIAFAKYAATQGITGVGIGAGSPFTMVGSMVEPSLLLRWIVKEPEMVQHLLDIAVQYLCETADILIREFGIENCSVSCNFPFESTNLLSPALFRSVAFPATLEVFDRFREKGLETFSIHICGNHNSNLECFKELKLTEGSFISSDEQNNLKDVAKVLGENYMYAGNVPTGLFVFGTPEDVYRASEGIIKDMKYNPGGFALMPSCDLPVNAKAKNVYAMLQAAKDFGRYE
jgi:uroporphyrinogen decarboxylase